MRNSRRKGAARAVIEVTAFWKLSAAVGRAGCGRTRQGRPRDCSRTRLRNSLESGAGFSIRRAPTAKVIFEVALTSRLYFARAWEWGQSRMSTVIRDNTLRASARGTLQAERLAFAAWIGLIWIGIVAGFGSDFPCFLRERPPRHCWCTFTQSCFSAGSYFCPCRHSWSSRAE